MQLSLAKVYVYGWDKRHSWGRGKNYNYGKYEGCGYARAVSTEKPELWLLTANEIIIEKYWANHSKIYSESYDADLNKSLHEWLWKRSSHAMMQIL